MRRTSAVVRARGVLLKHLRSLRTHPAANAQDRATSVTVNMLRAALARDNLARQLFIIDTAQPDSYFAGRVWDSAPDDSPVKARYFKLADELIAFITGDGDPETPHVTFDPPANGIHFDPPPHPAAAAAQILARYGATPRLRNRDRS